MSDPSSPPTSSDPASAGRYVVIARRYRPQAFDELVGQEHVARALQQAITSDRVGHAYLFTGARGVGKTSAARILAKALNCVHGPTPTPCNECDVCLRVASGDDVDVLEIDGASNRGIDEIRQLRQNVAVRPSRVRFKIYIIDEVHMLTKEAFNALLKTLEEPPEHVKFIFATTEPQKIPITILSRCQRFDFAGISSSAIQSRLAQIAAAEGVDVEHEALQILASRAAGSMRDSQSLLEQLLAIGRDRITAADVNQLLGIAPAERLSGLVQHLVARDAAAALAELDATVQSGVEVGLLLDQLVGYFRDTMAAAVGCSPDQLLYALPSQADEVAQAANRLGLATILAIGQILDHTAARMRVSMHGRTLVEMAIVRICQLNELDDLAALIAELRGAAESRPQVGIQRGLGAEQQRVSSSPRTDADPPPAPAKKNAEVASDLATSATSLVGALRQIDESRTNSSTEPGAPREVAAPAARRNDPPHAPHPSPAEPAGEPDIAAPAADSVLAQFQRAMAEGVSPRPAAAPPRPSRREQTAKAAEHPFIRRAMELFDVSPDKLRYTPPEGDAQ
ncbi:MAG: DNA polymerase III subunit gamma/tau [Planctomycetes bacterium]|nr:DNA polymerase III subunit gamma/tau [Planctomycetota bacterium]